jgi:Cu/Ag efflux protein CusF
MRNIFTALAAGLIALSAQFALAQRTPAEGQVTKIDAPNQKMTLRHGPIKNLDMDSMTMVFRVKDPAMLKMVKVGDKVRFEAERVDGAITIVKLEKLK